MSKVFFKHAVGIALTAAVVSSQAFALPALRTDITINDGGDGSGTGWYSVNKEDQEVEKGMATSQAWDMEGFFIDNSTGKLGMIGGFDLLNGVSGYPDYKSGDIFIDTDGNYIAGSATVGSNGFNGSESYTNYGYEYALDVDWANNTYNIINLSPDAVVESVFYGANYGSGAFRYVSGGTVIGSGTYSGVVSGLTNAQTGYLGGTHYAAYGFDLNKIANDSGSSTLTTSFTMGCGNDHLLGTATNVAEPATVALLGLGLAGLGLVRRRKQS
jgi:hypothetical protein